MYMSYSEDFTVGSVVKIEDLILKCIIECMHLRVNALLFNSQTFVTNYMTQLIQTTSRYFVNSTFSQIALY